MQLRLLLPVLALVAGCSSDPSSGDESLEVLAAAYPFAWAAEQVAGPDASVRNLVEGGGEPHDVELTPRQVQALGEAGLVVFMKDFQPAVDDAVRDLDDERRLELSAHTDVRPLRSDLDGESGDATDPHVWLDPTRMQAVVRVLGERLAEVDPDHADGYRERAASTVRDLAALESEYDTRLATCERRDLVTAHTAFGYLATRYDLTQVGVTGLDPESEPSPGRVAKVARWAKERGVTTVFSETIVESKIADTVAREIGARTAVLDPVEGVQEGQDYLSVMRSNLDAIAAGLGCR